MSDLSLSKGNYICVFSHDGTRLVTTNSSLQLGGSNSSNVIHCETPESFQLPPIATGQGKHRLPGCFPTVCPSVCLSVSIIASTYIQVHHHVYILGPFVQSVLRLTADPGVTSLIRAGSHTFVEIDHEVISKVILLLPLIQEGNIVVSYK